MSLTTILMTVFSTTLIYAAPLIFTALGGTFSERSGVVNVGLEGMMIVGAFSSTVFNLAFANVLGSATPWISLLVGAVFGLLFSILHAVATINFRADHIISGTVLNLMAPALCVFLTRIFYSGKGQTPVLDQSMGTFTFPVLSQIPFIGKVLFTRTSLVAFLAVLVGIASWYFLYRTNIGLRLRSVGENPTAADTLGINVGTYRYLGVLLSGFLGGIGGAVMAQSITLNFSASTISGQGFMSLAAMIFGKWNPLGATGAAIFFGLAQSLPIIGGYIPVLSHVNSVWFQIAPYAITVIVLVFFLGKAVAPAADGQNYIKGK
ncbi:ABC transporter permease [Liquorilactobacillus satsumensis]|uniref:Carbohydrate uptake ABC superfamily, ATP binding cassette transporter, membrane protein n=1 Tax=Liquorilactobacillus satsumensis DSM 16230 = JCM 12392 TaxID=1423801 RepID=A0A0R1V479_9LACO|nr:ABC transporter permease [Liquorilactobacillus satsumensis]KRM00303.1 carbohydrate uptake ABC superfamily, ATP binding cassette transporter, membrane protein [Liquorilactobacillus satsumensis DSM 16230 = JCM 12392]MCC7666402.1 ABC transporter permease [Liquorilactobacillus satsumensis]MCP9313018.1 ABC transporter permease [Liquorilactobacillus satsumensis]MCP9328964.1 ABC transporter permease [Liquorilactobacillus satsumensis]MCP9357673.1 ABC transporter permease [Liquorilactobacillus satsu